MPRIKQLYPLLRMAMAGVTALLLALVAGCVERQETIVAQPDGSTSITVQFTADSEQELAETATPSEAEGWKIDRWARQEKDGKKKYLLTASKVFAAGQRLPTHDGSAAAPDAALQLQFSTALTVEKRADGKYYLFHRTFEPRPYARWNPIEDREADEQLGKMLKEKNNKLTAAEWQDVIRRQIDMQLDRRLDLARAAYLEVTPVAPLDQWLRVRNQVVEVASSLDTGRLAELLRAAQTPARDKALAQAAQDSETRIDAAIHSGLAMQGYNAQQLVAFDRAWATLRRRNDITGQIETESFIVRVQLPGQIVGANATAQKDGTLEWRINGKQLMDRPVELLAASRVAAP